MEGKAVEELKKRNIVTVTGHHPLYGYQGEVLETIEDDQVVVFFGEEVLRDHPSYFKDGIPVETFSIYFLKKEQGYNTTTKAKRLFKNNWSIINSNPVPFTPKSICQVEDCEEKAIERCLVNIVDAPTYLFAPLSGGSINEVDLCGKHKECFHGHYMDSFPWKK